MTTQREAFEKWFTTFVNELKDTRIKNDYVANMLKMEIAYQAALSQPNEPVYWVLDDADISSWIMVTKEVFDRETAENCKMVCYKARETLGGE